MVTIADLMIAGDQSGCNALSNAATPDTCGHAIEVPDMNWYESLTAAKILDPGAATSGYENVKVKVRYDTPNRVQIIVLTNKFSSQQ